MTAHATSEEGYCVKSPDDQHCNCWWDGDACHFCEAPAMTMEQMVEQGMCEGPPRKAT